MDQYLLDSDILIDVLRGHSPAVSFLKELEGQDLLISSLTKAELVVGAKNKTDLTCIENFAEQFGELHPNAIVSKKMLQILKKHYLKHGIGIIDSFIAATAIEYELMLYSKNAKHFAILEELKVKIPY